jgi:hypothetical protein
VITLLLLIVQYFVCVCVCVRVCVCVYRCARQVANAQEYVRVCVELLNRRILICLCKCFASNHVDLVNVTYVVWVSAVHVFINPS